MQDGAKIEWDKAAGIKCPTCGNEIFRTYGPLKQCLRCLSKEVEVLLEQIECSKCKGEAVLVSHLSLGLLDQKVICSNCGSYARP